MYMQNTPKNPITTETKVAIGILLATVIIIAIGLSLFKAPAGTSGTLSEATVMKNISTGLTLDKNKVAPAANPHITGTTATKVSSSTTKIEVSEFLDYECPACAVQGEALTKMLVDTYGDRVVITRRIFPVHGQPAIEVARMVLAAQDVSPEAYQNLHGKVFETQSDWAKLGTKERVGFFKKLTADLGLDYDTLVAVGKSKYAAQIDADNADAQALRVRATPSFIINNSTLITGGVPFEYFERYIDAI